MQRNFHIPSWKKIIPIAFLFLFGISTLSNSILSTSPYFQNIGNPISEPVVSAQSPPPPEKMGLLNPQAFTGGGLGLSGGWNAWVTSTGCAGVLTGGGTYVNTTTYFRNTANDVDSKSGPQAFTIQDNIFASNNVWMQLIIAVYGDSIGYGLEMWGNGWNGGYAYYGGNDLSYYPASAGYSIQQALTYGSGYVPSGLSVKILDNGNLVNQFTVTLTSNVTESTRIYQSVIAGFGDYSNAQFSTGAGTITYESSQPLFIMPQWTPAGSIIGTCAWPASSPETQTGQTGESSDINYASDFSGQGTTSITQQWTAPISDLYNGNVVSSAGTHSYFGIMTTDGSVSTLESNYPSWNTYSSGGGSVSSSVSSNQGLIETISSSSWADAGLVNSTALDFSAGATLSFQISTASNSEAHVAIAPTYSTGSTEIFSTSNYLDFSVSGNYPQIKFNNAGNIYGGSILWHDSQQADYSAYSVRLGYFGQGLTVYLNTGTGWQEVYNNPQLVIGFDLGYVYAFARTDTSSSASFAYISSWIPNNPKAEGTIDQNVWYLIRHYEQITGGTYSGDAVILDTSVPPLWLSIPQNSAYMYAGMATESLSGGDCKISLSGGIDQCQVVSGVTYTDPYTQNLSYLFCYAAICPSDALQNVENGGALSGDELAYVTIKMSSNSTSPDVTYEVTTTPCSSSCSGYNYDMYLGGTLVASSGNGVQNYQTTVQDGLPGMRFVSRHVTSITGLLFDELGYQSMGVPLLNYISAVMAQCGSGCSSPYYEYYSPMFPTVVNNTQLPSNWYDSYNAFPAGGFYSAMTDGTSSTFTIPNSGGYSQWSDPYVSRLSVPGADQILWIGGIQSAQGYYPATDALQAEYLVNSGSSNSNATLAALAGVGWNGVGTSEKACAFTTGISGSTPVCYTETAYTTPSTAVFLSAASSVASHLGNPGITYEAEQAAGVLENLLWSGTGSISGVSNPETLWQYVGGEDSTYNPVASSSSIGPGPSISSSVQYASNEGGIFGSVSSALQEFGVNGVQPPESPGFEPVATEATGLSAAALLNYVKAMSGLSSVVPKASFVAAVGVNLDTLVTCSPSPSDCAYSTAETGIVRFKTTFPGVFNATVEQPYAINQPVYSAYGQAQFEINGTIPSGEVFTVQFNLRDALTDHVVASQYQALQAGTYQNKYLQVGIETGSSIRPGTYLLQMEAYGSGDFMTNGGFVKPIGLSLLPNTISDVFANDSAPFDNWQVFNLGGASCSISMGSGSSLVITGHSPSTSTVADCGLRSKSSISYLGGPLVITATTTTPQSDSPILAAVAISPERMASSSSVTGGIENALPDYLILENGGYISGGAQYARVLYRSNGGSAHNLVIQDPDSTIHWLVEIYPNGLTNIFYSSYSMPWWTLAEIPGGSLNTNLTSVYTYLFLDTTQTATYSAEYETITVTGTPDIGMATNTGQMNDYGAEFGTIPGSSTTISGTGPEVSLPEFTSVCNPACSYLYSNSSTTDFNSVETVSYWMIPFTIGGNNAGTGTSTMVVDNGGCCGNWWFEYYNSGEFDFNYVIGGSRARIETFGLLNQTNIPYFITGVWNSSGNELLLYVNGMLRGTSSTSGFPDTSAARQLLVGTGLCGQGDACDGGFFQGLISGLAISPGLIASRYQVDQMMQSGFSGSQLGGGYWYPLTFFGGFSGYHDMFGAGPQLIESNVIASYAFSDFPYAWASSIWNPYANPDTSANPFTFAVNQTYGTYGSYGIQNQGPSIQVKESNCGTSCLDTGPSLGVNLAPVDLSTYNTNYPLMLSFNYRATSSYTSSCDVTGFDVMIQNITGTTLFNQGYCFSNGDSGWQTFTLNIAPYLNNSKSIEIFIGAQNHWAQDWNIEDWFDNFQVYAPQQPSFQALSLYRYLPTSPGASTYSFTAQGGVEIPNYSPPVGAFTTSVWFEPVNLPSASDPRIVANDHTDWGVDQNQGFQIVYSNGGGFSGTTGIGVDIGSGSSTAKIIVPATLGVFQWYNVAVTYDGNNMCVYLYQEGSGLIGSACSAIGAGYSMSTGHYPLSLGFNPQYAGAFFQGAVSDLRVYNYAISSQSATQIFADGPTSNLLQPNSLWLPLSGSLADALGTGITAVPYIGSQWYNNYVSFITEA